MRRKASENSSDFRRKESALGGRKQGVEDKAEAPADLVTME